MSSLTGCPVFGVPCGNANPDPCICNRSPPDSPQCEAEDACQKQGGTWELFAESVTMDAGSGVEGHCVLPGSPDAAIIDDAPVDAHDIDASHAIPPD